MIRAASQMPFLLSLSIIILFLRMPYVLFAHFNVEPECIFCISRIFQACTCAYVACVCVSVCCVRTTVQHLVLQLIVEDKKKKEKKREWMYRKKRSESLCSYICIARWTIVALILIRFNNDNENRITVVLVSFNFLIRLAICECACKYRMTAFLINRSFLVTNRLS